MALCQRPSVCTTQVRERIAARLKEERSKLEARLAAQLESERQALLDSKRAVRDRPPISIYVKGRHSTDGLLGVAGMTGRAKVCAPSAPPLPCLNSERSWLLLVCHHIRSARRHGSSRRSWSESWKKTGDASRQRRRQLLRPPLVARAATAALVSSRRARQACNGAAMAVMTGLQLQLQCHHLHLHLHLRHRQLFQHSTPEQAA